MNVIMARTTAIRMLPVSMFLVVITVTAIRDLPEVVKFAKVRLSLWKYLKVAMCVHLIVLSFLYATEKNSQVELCLMCLQWTYSIDQ